MDKIKRAEKDIEIHQENIGYPGNPPVEGSGKPLNIAYIVGKNPKVSDVSNQTDRPDRKLS